MASEPVTRNQSVAAFIPEFEHLIAEVMEEWKVPGLAVAIVQDLEVAFLGVYGHRDAEAGLNVTTGTQFQIMSVSKSFAATGLAVLADERRLDWNRPVREYIPEFRLHDAVASDRVTVRDLLCHHSGLPRHDWIWLPGDLSSTQMLTALRYLEPGAAMRSAFQYSNLNYFILRASWPNASAAGAGPNSPALSPKGWTSRRHSPWRNLPQPLTRLCPTK